jgi:hypothetical protein
MSRTWKGFIAVAAVSLFVIVSAVLIAPRWCHGGLEVYFWCGVAALVILLLLPFCLRTGNSPLGRFALALGFAIWGTAVWITSVFLANVDILCRLI